MATKGRPDWRSDTDLVQLCNKGDAGEATRAFETLYKRHKDYVIRVALRFVPDQTSALDVLQKIFSYLLRKFPPAGPGLVLASNSLAADGNDGPNIKANSDSPVRGIQRDLNSQNRSRKRRDGYRTIDGSGNNLTHPNLNAAQTQLNRMMLSDYADYVAQMPGLDRPGPREISNAVSDQADPKFNTLGVSDYVWQWGQFVDHDIDLTGGVFPAELAPVQIPPGDPHFDPDAAGNQVMQFNRSIYDPSTGTGPNNSRQQMNEITGWIDASNVYGSATYVPQSCARTTALAG